MLIYLLKTFEGNFKAFDEAGRKKEPSNFSLLGLLKKRIDNIAFKTV
jgi:ribosomal protein S4